MSSRSSISVVIAKSAVVLLLLGSLTGIAGSIDIHSAAADSTGNAIVVAAASQNQYYYCNGGGGINGPSQPPPGQPQCATPGYDCMSLAQYAVYQVTGNVVPSDGEGLPGGTSWNGEGTGLGNDQSVLQPGDVVFFGGSDLWHYAHSGIYAGGGEVWDALATGDLVAEHTMIDLTSIYTNYQGAVRYSGSASPTTSVLIPSSGAALRGTGALLDASASAPAGVSSVQFVATGGSLNKSVIGTATPTLYGYMFFWNTTGVPDGTYSVQSLVTDQVSKTAYSPGVTVIVDNTPPTTVVIIPSTGAALRGTSAVLDASASDNVSVSKVQFAVTGGSLNKSMVGTATQSIYGYLCSWNTTTVPDGTYTLQSLATDEAGNTAYSSGITVRVDNTPPTTAVLIPSTEATLKGTSAVLDARASDNVSVSKVQFAVTGGSLNKSVIGTGTQSIYGYLCSWNTTTVPDGTYTLQSLATDEAGNTAYSPGITFKVGN